MSQKPKQTFLEKCYKDKNGKVIIGQSPNVPIIVWGVSRIILLVLEKNTTAYTTVSHIAFGSLFTWAWLELFSGANYFRRAAGIVVLLVIIF